MESRHELSDRTADHVDHRQDDTLESVASDTRAILRTLREWQPILFGERGRLGAVQKINIVWGFNTVIVGIAGAAIGSIITLLVQAAFVK